MYSTGARQMRNEHTSDLKASMKWAPALESGG